MQVVIVSWNILGKYNLPQLVDFMRANLWDLLIVLEPAAERRGYASALPEDVDSLTVDVGGENIIVLWFKTSFSSCKAAAVRLVADERQAVVLDAVAKLGASYRILTAHAPYRGNDGSAAQYQKAALAWAAQNGVALIMGDLNTYGSKVGASRSQFRNLSEGLKTSSGGHPLDKALINNQQFCGLPSEVYAESPAKSELEMLDTPSFQFGSRASSRESVQQSRQARGKQSDHQPLVVTLPATSLHTSQQGSGLSAPVSPGKGGQGKGGRLQIKDDGHCLYRCIAHFKSGNQDNYQAVRDALGNYIRDNWNSHPALQAAQNSGTLHLLINGVRTNLWGGELELALLAQIYGVQVTMMSAQGYANGVYGAGPGRLRIIHDNAHFYVE